MYSCQLTCKSVPSRRDMNTAFPFRMSHALIVNQRAAFDDIRPARSIVCSRTVGELDSQQRYFAMPCSPQLRASVSAAHSLIHFIAQQLRHSHAPLDRKNGNLCFSRHCVKAIFDGLRRRGREKKRLVASEGMPLEPKRIRQQASSSGSP